ncbi:EAL domain-containing protein [Aliikangiella sp. IMCC44359]|uniref:EAL domain-containing protein n=1 Tax=Aliikangiella sp. IMCC44359 TaxID=3459125 RepID=UPI00403AF045
MSKNSESIKGVVNIKAQIVQLLDSQKKINSGHLIQHIINNLRHSIGCHFASFNYPQNELWTTSDSINSFSKDYQHFDPKWLNNYLYSHLKSNEQYSIQNIQDIKKSMQERYTRLDFSETKNMFLPNNTVIVFPLDTLDDEKTAFINLVDKKDNSNFSKSNIQHINTYVSIIQDILLLVENNLSFDIITNELYRQYTSLKEEHDHLLNQQSKLTQSHERLEVQTDELIQLAQYDELTGLYNKKSMEERLNWLLKLAEKNEQKLAVIMLGLDNFKEINDLHGMRSGDHLLKEVSSRIQQCVRKIDTTARLGGDEFIIIMNSTSSTNAISEMLQRLQSKIAEPIAYKKESFNITSSIGYSLYPVDSKNADTLLKYADSAMGQAKLKGKNNFQYFSPEIHKKARAKISMEAELKKALAQKEFELYYQPQVDLSNGSICSFEALIRWNHPQKGLLSPNTFIPITEETKLIIPIGYWILHQVCEQLKDWNSRTKQKTSIAINLSVIQLSHPDFLSHIENMIKENAIPTNQITLEITESLSLDNPQKFITILDKLKSLGFKISIDDFGTGYSNLSYLKRFPIDEIKIDKDFVNHMTTNPHDKAIVTMIIAIAHNLGIRVVAEGVETKAQLALLSKSYCDVIQGFYFSKPVPAEQGETFLKAKTQLSLEGIKTTKYARTILLVDDEPQILSALRRALRSSGLIIHTANNADEALEILALNHIGVVLSDLSMPKVNGIELLSSVQQMYPQITRMILSGNNEFDLVKEAINKSSIFKYMTKPWSKDELRNDINEAFKHHERNKNTTY